MSVVVIGGGLGGLAASCTLAARGHRVTLLERNSWLGGKAAELRADGFRFDMGPTILTMPSVLERIFAEAGQALADRLDLRRLDPQWRCFYDDGSVLDLRDDRAEACAAIGALAGDAERAAAERFFAYADRLKTISDRFFLWQSVGGVADMLKLGNLLHLPKLIDLKPATSYAQIVRSYSKDARVAQMLDHFTQYVGSDPNQAPAVLGSIASLQLGEGVWYPIGGTRAVPEALAKLAGELGVELITGDGVAQIRHERGAVVGVTTDSGREIACQRVVSNMDAVRTHRELLSPPKTTSLTKACIEPACSGVVLYLGLDRRYEQLAHHAFVFSRDPEEEFEAIYHKGELAPDPTCYLATPAITEPGVAPEGGEALYILVHAPYLRPGQDWSQMLPAYREVILDKLARAAGMDDLREHIVTESALTPQDIHDRYHVLQGAIYGTASHGTWNGAFKPPNRDRHLRGLYLAGGAAHPGPGMPMALMSGWIAADALHQDA